MAIWDLDNYTDAISDAVDAIGDAGDLIGGILKSISPILAAVPGFGTAFAVAVYAAGALAAKDKITDAMIGTASAAMPPGIPRVAFDGATNITRDIADGRDAFQSTINACREAADKAGGGPAVAAFDSGMAVMRGGKIDQRVFDEGRAFALAGGGQAAAASYDAGVAIAQGKGADQVCITVARGYINEMGGSGAIAAFDTGIALAYGKTLQEAGYIGLHTFVKGNNGIEKVLNFVEQVGRAKNAQMAVQQLLESELADDFLHAVNQGVSADSSFIDKTLKPCIDKIHENFGILECPAGELAKQWGLDEAIIREAQALMRSGDGTIDEVMLNNLKNHKLPQSFDFSEHDITTHDGYAKRGRKIIDAGARWRLSRLLSDIRNGSSFTITIDAVEGVERPQIVRALRTYVIDDAWRRGFEIAIGLCEGSQGDNQGQQKVRISLGAGNIQCGFDAGQEIQFDRTDPLRWMRTTEVRKDDLLAISAQTLPMGVTRSMSAAEAAGTQPVLEQQQSSRAQESMSKNRFGPLIK